MPSIVVDASPLNYLICIDLVEILPRLYGQLCIPPAVHSELSHPKAPFQVRQWVKKPQSWLNVVAPKSLVKMPHTLLGSGEYEAISLALEIAADLVLMDDRDAVIAARELGIATVGTLAVLDRAAEKGWIDLADAFDKLIRTSFRSPLRLMTEMLEQDAQRKRRL